VSRLANIGRMALVNELRRWNEYAPSREGPVA
jgi:hypothetical protein